MDIELKSLPLTIPLRCFLRWRASEFGGRQVLDNHQVSCPLGVMLNQGVCGGPLSQRALSSGTMAGCRVPRVSNGNVYDQPPLKSQTRNKGDCHDESDDLTWRCCLVLRLQSGLGAACHQQSGLVRSSIECKLPNCSPSGPYTSYGWRRAYNSWLQGTPSSLPSTANRWTRQSKLFLLVNSEKTGEHFVRPLLSSASTRQPTYIV
jgi:hypothetical protein